MRTVQDQLREKKKVIRKETQVPMNTNVRKKTKEQLTRKEWEDLMGVNRETYQKQGGVYRRRR